jgi:hypothetical protein
VINVARLPDTSKLRVRPGKNFQEAHPNLDVTKATVLAEPVFVLPDGRVLEADVLFNPRIAQVTGWVGFGSLVAGGYCLWKGFRAPRRRPRRTGAKKNERPTPLSPAAAYDRLAREQELSLHPFSWKLVLARFLYREMYLFPVMIGVVIFLYAAVQAFQKGKSDVFAFCLVITVLLVYGLFHFTFMSVGALFQRISGFAVYHSGIRWQQGSQTHAALWQDIAEVYRAEVRCFSRGGEMRNTFSTLKLKLYDGRVLRMSADTYGNFEALAHAVQSTHGGWIAAVKRQELEEHGEAWFGDIAVCNDGLVLNGRFYNWAEIQKYEVENGSLNFYHQGGLFSSKTSFPLLSIPNSSALLSLLAEDLTQVIRGRRKVVV